MKKYLGLVLLLVSFTSYGQFVNYVNINGRYKWIAGKFDSTFTLPSGTTPSLRVGGGTGPGALFYNTSDSVVYQYTGSQWRPLHGSDTGRIQIAYVRNTTASPMTTGQVVYINGSTGNVPTVALANNKQDSTSAMTFGFVRGSIPVNGFGWITTFGPIDGINTNAYTEGEVIYLDSIAGQFTHDKPQAPYHMVTLGYIVKKSGNGIIFVKIQNGYELEELHNVRITSPVRNNGILSYDSVAQLWKDTTLSAIGGVTGSGTSGQVAYWTGTSSQSGSNNLLWDNTNARLRIGGGADGGQRLQVNGDVLFKGSGNTSGTTALTIQNSDGTLLFRVSNNAITFLPTLQSTTGALNIFHRENISTGINFAANATTTSTSGSRNTILIGESFAPTSGTATLTVNSINPTINQTGGANGITRGLYVNPTLTAAADWRSIEWSNNSGWGLYGAGTAPNYFAGNLTIGSTLNFAKLYVGGITASGTAQAFIFSQPSISGALNDLYSFRSSILGNLAVTITNAYHFTAQQNSLSSSTVTNQFGFFADNTLTGATNNFGFYGNIASGTGRWNLYMNGTAPNFLAGTLSIATNGSTRQITISGTGTNVGVDLTSTSALSIYSTYRVLNVGTDNATVIGSVSNNDFLLYSANTERARITSGGNFLIGSAVDGGQRLQVTGTTQLTPAANSSALTSTGYSVTGSGTTSLINLSGTWNTTGAPTAILMNITNTASNSASLLMDLQVGGVTQFRVTRAGTIFANGLSFRTDNLTSIIPTNDGFVQANNGDRLRFTSNLLNTAGYGYIFRNATGSLVWTSGTGGVVTITTNYAPTSGTGQFNILYLENTINQTGGANGITRGLYINPTLTAAADWRAIETTQGSLRMADTYLAGSGSLAGSLIDLTQTWNTTGSPTLIKANVTDNASADNSLLMDLQVGGASQFMVRKTGAIRTSAPAGGTANDWKLGTVSTTTPTSPNRTIEVEIGGTIYYIHAKTTND